jgi:hypothetical protein
MFVFSATTHSPPLASFGIVRHRRERIPGVGDGIALGPAANSKPRDNGLDWVAATTKRALFQFDEKGAPRSFVVRSSAPPLAIFFVSLWAQPRREKRKGLTSL